LTHEKMAKLLRQNLGFKKILKMKNFTYYSKKIKFLARDFLVRNFCKKIQKYF